MPVIASVGKSVPPYQVTQEETRRFARGMFSTNYHNIDKLLTAFHSARIEKRHFCVPARWFEEPHTWQEKNALYVENAIGLGAAAIKKCLEKAGFTPSDVDVLIYVSSTGISTPSIDAYIFNLICLRSDVIRVPVWGLGCGGGVAGIARGLDMARTRPDSRVVVCCVELCGLTFVHNDRSKSNLIATSLFGDGAAAVLILGDKAAAKSAVKGPSILGAQSAIWPHTLDVMGWDVRDEGLMVVFSRDIPRLVQETISPTVREFITRWAGAGRDISCFIAHPGGVKVLKAYEESLGLPANILNNSREVLRDYGNMSSCTVLFVLERELQESHEKGELGLMLALGPGFCCELVMLQW